MLEPYAFAELLFDVRLRLAERPRAARGAKLPGRTARGAGLPSRRFTLIDDGRDPSGLPKAFDFEGVPKQAVTIVEDGVAQDVVWDRRSAARAGKAAGRPATRSRRPRRASGRSRPTSSSSPASASLDELAERVGDGIYVTRLHYLSVVDAREGIITGMTRDGTFRIETGG